MRLNDSEIANLQAARAKIEAAKMSFVGRFNARFPTAVGKPGEHAEAALDTARQTIKGMVDADTVLGSLVINNGLL